jgi:hypothetical protein
MIGIVLVAIALVDGVGPAAEFGGRRQYGPTSGSS